MKSKFLVQISRGLIFSLLVSGLPIASANAASTGTGTTPTTGSNPPPATTSGCGPATITKSGNTYPLCVSGGTFAPINTSFGNDTGATLANDQKTAVSKLTTACSSCSSYTTPVQSATGKQNPDSLFLQATSVPFTFSDVTLFQTSDQALNGPKQYSALTSNLTQAFSDYLAINNNFLTYSQLYNSLLSIAVNNVMSNTSCTVLSTAATTAQCDCVTDPTTGIQTCQTLPYSQNPSAAISGFSDGGSLILPFSTTSGSNDSKKAGFGQQNLDGTVGTETVYYPNGDFRPAVTSQDQAEQLLRGFIQYQFNIQPAGSEMQQHIAFFFASILLYAGLSEQYFVGQPGSYLTPTNYGEIASVFDPTGKVFSYTPAQAVSNLAAGTVSFPGLTCPTAGGDNCYFPAGLNFNSQFTNSNAPAIVAALVGASINGALNLPTFTPGDHSLFNLLSGVDWTQFHAAFSNTNNSNGYTNPNLSLMNQCTASFNSKRTADPFYAPGIANDIVSNVPCNSACGVDGAFPCGYMIYLQGSLAQIVAGNAYYSCNVDPDTGYGLDASLYYGDPATITTAQISLSDQVGSDLSSIPSSASLLQSINNVIANQLGGTKATTFSYNKGDFYYWLPDTLVPAGTSITINGPGVSMNNPVKPGTGPGTNWYAVCMGNPNNPTASTLLYNAASAVVKSLQPLSGPAVCNSLNLPNGGLGCRTSSVAGQTLQDAQYNLLNAAQAALGFTPPGSTQAEVTAAQAAAAPLPALATANSKVSALLQTLNVSFQASTQGTVLTAQGKSTGSEPFSMGGVNVDPAILATGSGATTQSFDEVFGSSAAQAFFVDLGSIRQNYATCWSNVVDCANARLQIPPKGPAWWKALITPAAIVGQVSGLSFGILMMVVMHKWQTRQAAKAAAAQNADKTNQSATDAAKSTSAAPDTVRGPHGEEMRAANGPGGRTDPSAGQDRPDQPTQDGFETGGFTPEAVDSSAMQQLDATVKAESANLQQLIAQAKAGDASALKEYLQNLVDETAELKAEGQSITEEGAEIADADTAITDAGIADALPRLPTVDA